MESGEEKVPWWKFWQKKVPPQLTGDEWLRQQSAWMEQVFTFLRQHDPDMAADLAVRVEIMLLCPRADTPKRVTEIVQAELGELLARCELEGKQ